MTTYTHIHVEPSDTIRVVDIKGVPILIIGPEFGPEARLYLGRTSEDVPAIVERLIAALEPYRAKVPA